MRRKHSPLVILADGLILLLLFYGLGFSFCSVFELNVSASVLLGVLSLLAALFLTIYSLPRHGLTVLLVLLVLYGLFLWRSVELIRLGNISAYCSIVNVYADELSFLDHLYPVTKLEQAQWQAVTTLSVCTIAAPYTGLVAWAVVRRRSFWLTFWFTFPLIVAPLAVTHTPDWLPLMAVVACWTTLLLSSLTSRRHPDGGARVQLVSLPSIGVLLLLLSLLFPRQGYEQPAWAADAQLKLLNSLANFQQDILMGGTLPGPFRGGFMSAAASETVDLSAAGPLNYTGRTVLKVQTQVRGKIYLRGFSAAVYTGTGWEGLPDTESIPDEPWRSSMPPPSKQMLGELLGGHQPLNFPAMTAPYAEYHPVTIENVAAPDGCVYFPYQLMTTPEQVAGAQFVDDSYLARDRNVRTHTLYYRADAEPEHMVPLTGAAAEAEEQYRTFVYANYLDVPYEVETALSDWIQNSMSMGVTSRKNYSNLPWSIGGPLTIADSLTQVLDLTTEYDPQVEPISGDFVSVFLNDTKRGYCMHYASAAALLFRIFGTPSRYVSGYVASVPASGKVNVPDYAAHAWVEIYLDGYGWYPVDVTPGYEGRALPWASAAETDPSPTPSPAASHTPSPSRNPQSTPSPTPAANQYTKGKTLLELIDPRFFLACAIVFVTILALILRRLLARRLRTARLGQADTNKAVLAAYAYHKRLLRRSGVPSDELDGLAQKAKFSQHTLTEEERQMAVSYVSSQAERIDEGLSWFKRLLFRYLFGFY